MSDPTIPGPGLTTDEAAQAFRQALAFADAPTDGLHIATLPNLRDLGGWTTSHGRRVRSRQLYRSVATDRLDADGLDALAGLGIRTVFDLRTHGERTAAPDRLPEGTVLVPLDVLADESASVPAHLAEVFADPSTVGEHLGDGKAEALFTSAYGSFVTLPSALASYRALFTQLADADSRPALIHCTTGKDRTGWGAAALLTWLGVSEADVLTDYLRTNELLRPSLQPVYDRFGAAGGDTDILDAVLGVRQEYLVSAFEAMHAGFGSVEQYFAAGLGLHPGVADRLRAGLLD